MQPHPAKDQFPNVSYCPSLAWVSLILFSFSFLVSIHTYTVVKSAEITIILSTFGLYEFGFPLVCFYMVKYVVKLNFPKFPCLSYYLNGEQKIESKDEEIEHNWMNLTILISYGLVPCQMHYVLYSSPSYSNFLHSWGESGLVSRNHL